MLRLAMFRDDISRLYLGFLRSLWRNICVYCFYGKINKNRRKAASILKKLSRGLRGEMFAAHVTSHFEGSWVGGGNFRYHVTNERFLSARHIKSCSNGTCLSLKAFPKGIKADWIIFPVAQHERCKPSLWSCFNPLINVGSIARCHSFKWTLLIPMKRSNNSFWLSFDANKNKSCKLNFPF